MIIAGKSLFAERGFAGASVRDICQEADASSTMIHHYFGNKQGLYDEIINQFTSATFEVPLRLISKPAATREEFLLRLELFISETFRALILQAPVIRILARESSDFVGKPRFHEGLSHYLSDAQKSGFLDAELEVEMVTGLVLDRLGNQIMYAATTKTEAPNVLNDTTFADAWLAANTKVLLHGLAGAREGK